MQFRLVTGLRVFIKNIESAVTELAELVDLILEGEHPDHSQPKNV